MKTFTLPFQKTSSPISYNQVQELTAFDNLVSLPSTSQMTKRMDEELFEEIIEALESGEQVTIEG